MKSGISIVIRSCNEAKELENLLLKLESQIYNGPIEIILVDNDSSDSTMKIAQSHHVEKIVNIPKGEFTFPKSMNMGVACAQYEIVILTVAHALPISKNWLNSAAEYFKNETVAGVFAHCIPQKRKTLAEIIFYYPLYILDKIRSPRVILKTGMGIMGATNCALRRSLWEKKNFNEAYELGGEDGEWADWSIKEGFKIIMDVDFTVFHSHYLGFKGLYKQIKYWAKLANPTVFNNDEFLFRGKVFHNK